MLGEVNIDKTIQAYGDRNTILLITDTIEDKSRYHTAVENVGRVLVTSDIQRDGRNSLYITNGRCLQIYNAAAPNMQLMFGANNWTIEMWIYGVDWRTGAEGGFISVDFSAFNRGTNNGICTLLWGYRGQYFYMSTTGDSWNICNGRSVFGGVQSLNTWHHFAIVRSGNSFMNFVDGILKDNVTYDVTLDIPREYYTHIGAYRTNTTINSQTMYIQDIRFSNIARYTTTFTPPIRLI